MRCEPGNRSFLSAAGVVGMYTRRWGCGSQAGKSHSLHDVKILAVCGGERQPGLDQPVMYGVREIPIIVRYEARFINETWTSASS